MAPEATRPAFGSQDAMFGGSYVDVDEWRDEPVRHRYVHGGFSGTETRFSLYFPPPERYQGRFFHWVNPWSGSEHVATTGGRSMVSIDFAVDSGAYLVESNQGRLTATMDVDDPTVHGYRASAATAQFSRSLAAEMYGDHRPYGYVYGGSGGAFRTISCFENRWDVWDGAVPFIQPHPASLPNQMSALAHAIRLLRSDVAGIVDAVEPGGSGDLYEGLTVEQREALAHLVRLGFPPRAFFYFDGIARLYTGVAASWADSVGEWDPEYFDDFWTKPGYLGADSASVAAARVRHAATVAEPVLEDDPAAVSLPRTLAASYRRAGAPVALRIGGLPATPNLVGATLTVTSGSAAGRRLYVVGVLGDIVLTGDSVTHHEGLVGVEAGDAVEIDNSFHLAFQTYYRHQVHPDHREWAQFCAAGTPIYPQRPSVAGKAPRRAAGSNYSGRFAGRMIVVQNLVDEGAWPSNALYYRGLVESALGPALDDRYRLWFTDHALHTPPVVPPDEARPVRTTRVIDHTGVVQQALRDVSAWVEHGVAPPVSTAFEYADGQIRVAPTARERGGIQPIVSVTVNGGARADVREGEPASFTAVVEVPPGVGTIVAAEWDFDGSGDFATSEVIDGSQSWLTLARSHAFEAPGTYFPALRVAAHRHGDVRTPHARVQNLGRVRVVVR